MVLSLSKRIEAAFCYLIIHCHRAHDNEMSKQWILERKSWVTFYCSTLQNTQKKKKTNGTHLCTVIKQWSRYMKYHLVIVDIWCYFRSAFDMVRCTNGVVFRVDNKSYNYDYK